MNESITHPTKHFSPTASLAAIGVKLRQLKLFEPIRTKVQIKQKTVKYTPVDKLYDAFISLLAGSHGLVEINTRLRADPGLRASPLGARPVPNSRWYKKRWMPAPQKM
jgi:hypothetical protein